MVRGTKINIETTKQINIKKTLHFFFSLTLSSLSTAEQMALNEA